MCVRRHEKALLDLVDLVAERDPARRSSLVRAFVEEGRRLSDPIRLDMPIKSLEENCLRTGGRELLAVADPQRRLSGEAHVSWPILANDRICANLDIGDRRLGRPHRFATARPRTALHVFEVGAARGQNDDHAQGQQPPPH